MSAAKRCQSCDGQAPCCAKSRPDPPTCGNGASVAAEQQLALQQPALLPPKHERQLAATAGPAAGPAAAAGLTAGTAAAAARGQQLGKVGEQVGKRGVRDAARPRPPREPHAGRDIRQRLAEGGRHAECLGHRRSAGHDAHFLAARVAARRHQAHVVRLRRHACALSVRRRRSGMEGSAAPGAVAPVKQSNRRSGPQFCWHSRLRRRPTGRPPQALACPSRCSDACPALLASKFSAARRAAPMLAGVFGATSTTRTPSSSSGGSACCAAGSRPEVVAGSREEVLHNPCYCIAALLNWCANSRTGPGGALAPSDRRAGRGGVGGGGCVRRSTRLTSPALHWRPQRRLRPQASCAGLRPRRGLRRPVMHVMPIRALLHSTN